MLIPSIAIVFLAQAQPVLTLEQAYQEAQANNLDLKVAQARLQQADEISAKVWSGYLPQVSAAGTYTYNTDDASILFGNQVIDLQKKHQVTGQAQVTQGLIVPQLWPAIHNAYLAERTAELNVGYTRLEILFATAQLYYGAEGLREAIGVQDQLLEVNRQHEKDAAARFEAGTVTKVTLLRAQIERAKVEQDVIRTRNAYEGARLALATFLNRKPDFDVVRPTEPAAPGSLDELLASTTDKRLDVQASKTSLELAEGNKNAVYYRYAPSIGALGRFQISNSKGFTGRNGTWVFGATLNWNLFDGGLREAELRENRAKVLESQNSLKSAENNAKDQVGRAWLDRQSAEANRLKAEEQVKLARENAELVKNSFDAGVASYLEVEDANAAMRGAELTLISESLNSQLATIKLTKSAGLFNPVK